ncbi:MAG: hypothetical protein U5S82_22775 [Gammaproteobacteria bacterium]|nr:hypothetical protein [Gammaproteobacteria bacterium]
MNSRLARRCMVMALGAVLLGGCTSMKSKDRALLLNDALFQYASAMRWGHINTANSYRRAPDGTPLAGAEAFRDDIRVTAYKVLSQAPVDETHVQVEARLEYMSNQTGRITAVEDSQRWWYDADARRWFLDGRLPEVILAP